MPEFGQLGSAWSKTNAISEMGLRNKTKAEKRKEKFKMAERTYDCSGWATRYGLLCSDGRTIEPGAFAGQDGEEVPIVWGHDHGTPTTILGSALLCHKDGEGMYALMSFNNSYEGQHAKEAVSHRDIKRLSIYADHLKQQGGKVLNGIIKEVSLVYGGANPGAFIDNAVLAHSDGSYDLIEDEAIMYFGEYSNIELGDTLEHSDEKEDKDVAEEKKETKPAETNDDEIDVEKIINGFTEDQKLVIGYLIEENVKDALKKNGKKSEDSDDDDSDDDDNEVEHSDEGGEETMKYNAFEDQAPSRSNVICHADQKEIIKLAKDSRCGTLKNAIQSYMEDNFLQHDDTAAPVGGFDNTDTIGDEQFTSFTAMLPEYKDVNGRMPELITNDQGWISVVMAKTHKSPISRIRTSQVDIRNAEQLRAKGYQKGNKKQPTGQFKLARRTTDPQTVYVTNALHRDDIVDITDFDYVQYLYNIDRMMLNEELATAIMLGDSRQDTDEAKIFPEHIRPIWTDDDLYTIHVDLNKDEVAKELQGTDTTTYFGDNFVTAEAMVNTCLYSREQFRGTGTPDMFITPRMLNTMLLARDRNGHRLYSSKAELATALNVGNIYTAEQFANRVRTAGEGSSAKKKKLLALIVNMNDYALGSTKGGEVTHFTQFDIKFNQQLSLLETRVSGALTKIYSAIAIEEDVTTAATGD
jgi:hypothetical protein